MRGDFHSDAWALCRSDSVCAGKVRGQTPKVAKQDKKKHKTGRAKRRIQYNRRFVNVVAGAGKKKGPNCNNVA
jgi:small subunit ribosomal protein S30e